MTMQVRDSVWLGDQQFSLLTSRPASPFSPRDHGLRPRAASTMNWSGYHCSYRISDQKIYLDALSVNHSTFLPFTECPSELMPSYPLRLSEREVNDVPPPPLNGVSAAKPNGLGEWKYDGLAMELPYTGRITIGKGYIQGLARSADEWQFSVVLRLTYEAGALANMQDLSGAFAQERASILAAQKAHEKGKLMGKSAHRYYPPGPGVRNAELYDDDEDYLAQVEATRKLFAAIASPVRAPEPLISATAWATLAAFLLLCAFAWMGVKMARHYELGARYTDMAVVLAAPQGVYPEV